MSALFLSSGDLIADRRFHRAMEFLARQDEPAAADLLAQAIEQAPGFASAWFWLGELRERTGERAGAIEAFRNALAADAADHHGAALRLSRLGAAPPGEPMSAAYVRTLFDQYAPRYDLALVEGLHYHGPAIIRAALERAGRAP